METPTPQPSAGGGDGNCPRSSRCSFLRHEVPTHFKEPFIMRGYRDPTSSISQCCRSIFQANNESLNFWTHFLPSLFFWWRTYQFWSSLDLRDEAFGYPMVVYLVCMCTFPFTSALAHMFNTMSDRARHICFFLDYGAVSLYALGSAMAYKAYLFPDGLKGTFFADTYLYVATFCAVASLVISCETRFLPNGLLKKVMRFTAYLVPYVFDSIPVCYRIIFCRPEECDTPALRYQVHQFYMAVISAFLYTTHIPERLFPGRFDIIAHSHQLFHICSVWGAHYQMSGLLMYVEQHSGQTDDHTFPSVSETVGLTTFVSVMNTTVLILFIVRLYKTVPFGTTSMPNLLDLVKKPSFCNGRDARSKTAMQYDAVPSRSSNGAHFTLGGGDDDTEQRHMQRTHSGVTHRLNRTENGATSST